MSEISREDAIKKLNCHLKNNGYCDCDKCDYDTNASIVETLKKAISDMEKLDKIEQLYEPKPFGQGLSREDRDLKIEQILKEV